jgi:hypothetical protein
MGLEKMQVSLLVREKLFHLLQTTVAKSMRLQIFRIIAPPQSELQVRTLYNPPKNVQLALTPK